MTEFGKWFGESNGINMLSAAFENCTKEQARCAVTTYCLIFGIKPETKKWDELMDVVWNYYNCWFDSFLEMNIYMSEIL